MKGEVQFAFVCGTQMVVVVNDIAYTLGRKDDNSAGPLEWHRLPPIPGTSGFTGDLASIRQL